MNSQELEIAVCLGLPLLILIWGTMGTVSSVGSRWCASDGFIGGFRQSRSCALCLDFGVFCYSERGSEHV